MPPRRHRGGTARREGGRKTRDRDEEFTSFVVERGAALLRTARLGVPVNGPRSRLSTLARAVVALRDVLRRL